MSKELPNFNLMDFLDDPVEDIENQAKSYVSSFKNEKTIAKQRYWIFALDKKI